jgi:hypothetical protein
MTIKSKYKTDRTANKRNVKRNQHLAQTPYCSKSWLAPPQAISGQRNLAGAAGEGEDDEDDLDFLGLESAEEAAAATVLPRFGRA